MSDVGLDLRERRGHRAERKKRGGGGCLVLVLLAVLVLGGAYFGISKGAGAVSEWINGPEDYSGQGTGGAVIEVKDGDTVAAVGRTLKAEGVTASVDAFVELAQNDNRAQELQPGFYQLRKKMSSQWALDELSDPKNRVEGRVTVPEGSRVDQVVAAIVRGTDLTEADVTEALKKPDSLGLPADAKGDAEGYLFPATYTVPPGSDATQVLKQMIDKAKEVETELDLEGRAKTLGITKEEAVIVASLIEREASRDDDRPKVARVVYNRLEDDMPLELDSTVTYATKRTGDVFTTDAERRSDSPYNTYKNAGLPPGPISSPGEEALNAALNPAEGNWLFFVTVDLETGRTLFADDYSGHQKNVAKLRAYCKKSDTC